MKGVRKEAAAFLWLEALGTRPGYDPSVLSRQVLRKCSTGSCDPGVWGAGRGGGLPGPSGADLGGEFNCIVHF